MMAQCDGDNIGSWRVMQKVGMRKISDDGIQYELSTFFQLLQGKLKQLVLIVKHTQLQFLNRQYM